MRMNKKMAAMMIGLTMGFSGTALAAVSDGADSFVDVPKDHWSYEALDYLAKDGVIEGYADGTFQGNRTMTRYEMASIVAKAMQKTGTSIGDQAVLEKLEKEYGGELDTLKKRVDTHDKQIAALNDKTDKLQIWGLARTQAGSDDGKNMNYNNRFYMDLEGQLKVSDKFKARFTIEKNAHYRGSETVSEQKVVSDGRGGYTTQIIQHNHAGHDTSAMDQDHNGSISNVWVEGTFGKDWYVNVGRKWNGISYENLLWGNPCDGVSFYHPLNNKWWISGDYWTPTWDGAKYTMAALNVWGKVTPAIETNLAYARVVGGKDEYWTKADAAIAVGLKFHLAPTLALTTSYVKTNAQLEEGYWTNGGWDRDFVARVDYKGTDLNKVGSFGLYAKYANLGVAGDFGHDDEWTTRGETYFNGMRGWYLGFKYVPWQNVEWETFYATMQEGTSTKADRSDRKILRTMLDFHF